MLNLNKTDYGRRRNSTKRPYARSISCQDADSKAIIWNTGEELKQVSVSALVNNNVTKDAVPTEGSTNPVESGGVWGKLDELRERIDTGLESLDENKADNPFSVTFESGDTLSLADNTIYTASEPISILSLVAQGSGTSVVSFDTATSGTVTITFQSIIFADTPTFNNNEHWEIAVRNGIGMWLDGDTERPKLRGAVQTYLDKGLGDYPLCVEGVGVIPVAPTKLLSMLADIEVYAIKCLTKTFEHKEAVNALTTCEELANYNYTEGYPEKLHFEI